MQCKEQMITHKVSMRQGRARQHRVGQGRDANSISQDDLRCCERYEHGGLHGLRGLALQRGGRP